MPHYFNEIDPAAAEWLRELMKAGLIPSGEVDERSIKEVTAADLVGFTSHHFFAGVGGWCEGLRLAGWDHTRSVWTGSCPCQPFSSAGKRLGAADERDLWPDFFRLIKACRPPTVFGEQVASADVIGTELEAAFLVAVQTGEFARANKLAKRLAQSRSFHFAPRWITRIRADLEAEGYSLRWKVLGAHSVGAPHIRQRLYWVADAGHFSQRPGHGRTAQLETTKRSKQGKHTSTGCVHGRLAVADGGLAGDGGVQPGREHGREPQDGGTGERMEQPAIDGRRGERLPNGRTPEVAGSTRLEERSGEPGDDGAERPAAERASGEPRGVGDADSRGLGSGDREQEHDRAKPGRASDSNFWHCLDLIPCRDGKARRVEPGIFPLAHGVPGRVGLLRGAGNAICPQTAAAFIRAYREAKGEKLQ